jgi:hypothetical protein
MTLHGVYREIKKSGDVDQRLVEHILEDDHAALQGRQFGKARHRGFDRFLAHQHLHGVGTGRVGDVRGGIDRFGRAHRPSAQQVERAVMGYPKQPGSKRRLLLHVFQLKVFQLKVFPLNVTQRSKGPDHCVLHDVLAVDHRSHQTRAIAMQFGPQLLGQSEKLRPAVALQRLRLCAQSAKPSIIVTPVSPVSPKANPSACVGSSSTATKLSPKTLGGIGAPKRATNASGLMSMACA